MLLASCKCLSTRSQQYLHLLRPSIAVPQADSYPRPSPANFVKPGKRPLSSISPTIVEFPNGTLYYVTGAAGGSRIITATIQSLVNVLDRNMTSAQALAQPRLHDQLIPNQVSFEYAYNNETVAFMKSRGHNVTWLAVAQSSAQSIRRHPNGTFEAAGEPRQANSLGAVI
jgi:gamma-glutamyltranspeptidase / glutathione hydrolase